MSSVEPKDAPSPRAALMSAQRAVAELEEQHHRYVRTETECRETARRATETRVANQRALAEAFEVERKAHEANRRAEDAARELEEKRRVELLKATAKVTS